MRELGDSNEIEDCLENTAKNSQESTCQREGHIGEWQRRVVFVERITGKDKRLWRFFEEVPEWYRVCKRCGSIEVRRIMPDNEQ